MKKGRRPIYDIESLEIGQKMPLPRKYHQYRHQYLHAFKERSGYNLTLIYEDGKIYISREK